MYKGVKEEEERERVDDNIMRGTSLRGRVERGHEEREIEKKEEKREREGGNRNQNRGRREEDVQ